MPSNRMFCIAMAASLVSSAVAAPLSSNAAAGVRKDRHVLILGIDGLKPAALEKYLNDPQFKSARSKGVLDALMKAGRIRPSRTYASFPSYTWPAWGTIFTGHFPGKHGVMGQYFLLRDKGIFYNPDRTFLDGPRAFGWDFDIAHGKKVLQKLLSSVPKALRWLAKKGLARLAKTLSRKFQGFSWDKALGRFRARGHSFVTESLLVPTLYDYAFRAGLSVHNFYNFYHRKGAPNGVPDGFGRPSKSAFLRIALGMEIGKLFPGKGYLGKIVRGLTSLLGKRAGGLLAKAASWLSRKLGAASGFSRAFGKLVAKIRGLIEGKTGIAIGRLPEKYVNRVRGDVYFDQVSVAAATRAVKRWKRLPNVINVYQNAPDACSHKIRGDQMDIQTNCLAFVDRNTRPLIDAIKKHHPRAWRNTMVVVVSDHGHSSLRTKLTTADDAKLLGLAGLASCDYIEGRNGNMAHVYLLGTPSERAKLRNVPACDETADAKTAQSRKPARDALGYRGAESAPAIASAIARRKDDVAAGYAGIFARHADGRYRIYYAAKGSFRWSCPQGCSLEEFEKSDANRKVGFVALAKRVQQMSNPQRSGDIVLVTDANGGFGFSGSPSTHGGLQSSDSDFTLVFTGPALTKAALRPRRLLPAFQVDVTPTILQFLGVAGVKLTGGALFDIDR